MKKLIALLSMSLFSLYSHAADLSITEAWSPEAPPVAPVLAGYMKIHNSSQRDIRITGVESEKFKKMEIHLMEMNGSQMRMVKQDFLLIPAGKTVELQPGGLHLMIFRPGPVVKIGDSIPVSFRLGNGKHLSTKLEIKERPAADTEHHHHHH